MKRLALIGSKDFAEQLQILAEETGEYKVVGYFDDFEKKGTLIRSLPVLGKIDEIVTEYTNGFFDCVFLAAGYKNFTFRELVFNKIFGKVPFATIVSPSTRIGIDVKIGQGVYIGENSKIGDRTIIGNNVFMHGDTIIAHDNEIGDHTYLSGRINTAGYCKIGRRCFVGICVLFSEHILVVDDVWIGLGCVVAKNIKEAGKYMSPSAKLYKIE